MNITYFRYDITLLNITLKWASWNVYRPTWLTLSVAPLLTDITFKCMTASGHIRLTNDASWHLVNY